MDLASSLFGLLILSPILSLVALFLYLKFGRPILFRQTRPGLKGRPFVLYKFRTMVNRFDESGKLLPDEQRILPFGKFLRSSSIDELPELFNVLRGDMSLVGPRPLLMQYIKRCDSEQVRRWDVLPGITGWAQIHGRNTLSWEEKFKLDVWYVDHHNFWLDCKILFLTFAKVFQKEGISAEGHATMPEFMGSSRGKRDGEIKGDKE
jgi:sugar transferase EpsL